jgi:hypothetical protein
MNGRIHFSARFSRFLQYALTENLRSFGVQRREFSIAWSFLGGKSPYDKNGPSQQDGRRRAMPAYRKAFGALFTTVAAPVLVSVIVQELGVAQRVLAPQIDPNKVTTVDRGPRDILISHGLGSTPVEARREALRTALLQEVSSLPGTSDAAMVDQAIRAAVRREPRDVILHCENLTCRKQVDAGREWYCQEISVEVARTGLAKWLTEARD